MVKLENDETINVGKLKIYRYHQRIGNNERTLRPINRLLNVVKTNKQKPFLMDVRYYVLIMCLVAMISTVKTKQKKDMILGAKLLDPYGQTLVTNVDVGFGALEQNICNITMKRAITLYISQKSH